MADVTKLPPRRVSADGLALEVEGETYYPHVGDWVEFRRLGRVGQVLGLVEREEGEADSAYELRLRRDLEQWLAQKILRWHWTDDAGEAYPEHPMARDLQPLLRDEVLWLVAAAMGQITETDDDRKNGSSPSTSRSTAKKAGKSRRRGS